MSVRDEVICLTRGGLLPEASIGAVGIPMDKARKEAALAFLSLKARWPGAAPSQRVGGIDAELATMDINERIMLEIDLRGREVKLHSFDYDPCAYGRR